MTLTNFANNVRSSGVTIVVAATAVLRGPAVLGARLDQEKKLT